MKQLAGAVIGTLGLVAGAVLVLRPGEAPRTDAGARATGAPPAVERPAAATPAAAPPARDAAGPAEPSPTRAPAVTRPHPRPAHDEPEEPVDPTTAYIDELGTQAIDVIEQCLADHETGVTFDVSVDYRLQGTWIVVEAATTTPVIAAVEDCVADRLARVTVEPPPSPERFTRTTFSAGIVNRDGRRIETRGQLEWFDS